MSPTVYQMRTANTDKCSSCMESDEILNRLHFPVIAGAVTPQKTTVVKHITVYYTSINQPPRERSNGRCGVDGDICYTTNRTNKKPAPKREVVWEPNLIRVIVLVSNSICRLYATLTQAANPGRRVTFTLLGTWPSRDGPSLIKSTRRTRPARSAL